jgi:hypothetical protein
MRAVLSTPVTDALDAVDQGPLLGRNMGALPPALTRLLGASERAERPRMRALCRVHVDTPNTISATGGGYRPPRGLGNYLLRTAPFRMYKRSDHASCVAVQDR